VIGARSRSFRALVRLIERLPVVPLPPLAALPDAADRRARRDRLSDRRGATTAASVARFDIGGPEVLSYA